MIKTGLWVRLFSTLWRFDDTNLTCTNVFQKLNIRNNIREWFDGENFKETPTGVFQQMFTSPPKFWGNTLHLQA